jgi:hypothetical protein
MATTLPLNDPLVATAYALAQHWCKGHDLGLQPAFDHAVDVARTLIEHAPTAPPELVAAALAHDAPDFADVDDLDGFLTRQLGTEVTRIIHSLQHQHDNYDQQPQLDQALALVGTADKIVSLRSALDRAHAAPDLQGHWASHPGFVNAIPHFRAFYAAAEPLIPPGMAAELLALVDNAEALTAGAS